MVGQEPEEYRPRRAWVETPDDPATVEPTTEDAGDHDSESAAADQPRPGGASASEVETTVLPRTIRSRVAERSDSRGSRARSTSDAETLDDSDATDETAGIGSRFTQRSRLALLVGAVAAVVVLGLAVGYAVISLGDDAQAGPGRTRSTTGSGGEQSSAAPADAGVLLSDTSMLTAKDAKRIDGKRAWKVALTQKGRGDNAPQAACTPAQPAEGTPQPQQTILRTLASDGKDAPAVLHQADAYASADEATQAYTAMSQALGGCPMDFAHIESGAVVSNLGNQAVGVVVAISDGKTQFRTLVLNRTGRVVNIVDVARDGSAVAPKAVADALGQVTNDQCTAAVGLCATNVTVSAGPPPLGGDQPGFLATADIPPVKGQEGVWSGDIPGGVKDLFSGCEGLAFSTVKGPTDRRARAYLLAENADVPESFGLDEVLLTMPDAKQADSLVTKVRDNLNKCGKRSLTASVSGEKKFSGIGAQRTPVAGWVMTVRQKVDAKTTATYRVGIGSAGTKVVYTFLPTGKGFDFTDGQWQSLNVRAGQRASQVK
ncbi:hypothetical protein GCM10009841_11060 [Microlunatus panaciterrae]|uniref:Uncharacterized protein n=1 Tax=Microlunatus panaciterrae TaxID=400768 RepID=A0ABS2RKX9_9ACTN|nr:hypothetical protein [Microlunatus panaciterrae]MBM7799663.1 hypothetical protein [Microlunatus panaciterrae]